MKTVQNFTLQCKSFFCIVQHCKESGCGFFPYNVSTKPIAIQNWFFFYRFFDGNWFCEKRNHRQSLWVILLFLELIIYLVSIYSSLNVISKYELSCTKNICYEWILMNVQHYTRIPINVKTNKSVKSNIRRNKYFFSSKRRSYIKKNSRFLWCWLQNHRISFWLILNRNQQFIFSKINFMLFSQLNYQIAINNAIRKVY